MCQIVNVILGACDNPLCFNLNDKVTVMNLLILFGFYSSYIHDYMYMSTIFYINMRIVKNLCVLPVIEEMKCLEQILFFSQTRSWQNYQKRKDGGIVLNIDDLIFCLSNWYKVNLYKIRTMNEYFRMHTKNQTVAMYLVPIEFLWFQFNLNGEFIYMHIKIQTQVCWDWFRKTYNFE